MTMHKQHKWIPSNLKPAILIKEKDCEYHNVLFERISITPGREKYPVVKKWVKVFRAQDYKKYFIDCDQERKNKYLKSMGVDAAELVHDPNKIIERPKGNAPKPGTKTKTRKVKK